MINLKKNLSMNTFPENNNRKGSYINNRRFPEKLAFELKSEYSFR
jgi:hypothetical protein